MSIKLWLFLIYGCCLIVLSVFKTSEIFLPYIYRFEDFLGGDKLMHLKLSFLLTVMALVALMPSTKDSFKVLFYAVGISACLILGLAMDELYQDWASTRRFEWMDFAYGASGIGLGLLLYFFGYFLCPKLVNLVKIVRNG